MIWVLTTKIWKNGLPEHATEWYFDVEAQFVAAKAYAINAGIYVSDRQDYISDFAEFYNWAKTNDEISHRSTRT